MIWRVGKKRSQWLGFLISLALLFSTQSLASSPANLKIVGCSKSSSTKSFVSGSSKKVPSSEKLVFKNGTQGYKLNLIDFRHHDVNSEAITRMHSLVRLEVISTYEKEGLATEKVINTFMKGLDAKRAEPISWYYITHTAQDSTIGIVATAKLVRFNKSDMNPQSVAARTKLKEALPIIPRFDLEKKSKAVFVPELGRYSHYLLPEHEFFRQGPWIDTYSRLVKRFNSREVAEKVDSLEKQQILNEIRRLWEQIPEEVFSIAEITGVTSKGFAELKFSALKIFMDQIKTDAKSYGLKRLYLLAASEPVREKWKKHGFKELEGGSYFDEASGMIKTKMYLDLDSLKD
ncbi:MAG: hypothetical protein VX642_07385 [Bdellovibrionota bacterium]|nr:hypothetical protein [Bdellovibrionota bacterium]